MEEQAMKYPTLTTDRLSEREREVVADILARHLCALVNFALDADAFLFAELVSSWERERLPGDGPIRSALGEIQVLRRALGMAAFEPDEFEVLRGELR